MYIRNSFSCTMRNADISTVHLIRFGTLENVWFLNSGCLLNLSVLTALELDEESEFVVLFGKQLSLVDEMSITVSSIFGYFIAFTAEF